MLRALSIAILVMFAITAGGSVHSSKPQFPTIPNVETAPPCNNKVTGAARYDNTSAKSQYHKVSPPSSLQQAKAQTEVK